MKSKIIELLRGHLERRKKHHEELSQSTSEALAKLNEIAPRLLA